MRTVRPTRYMTGPSTARSSALTSKNIHGPSRAAVVVEDAAHPATAGVETRFTLTEEFYTFRDNPRPRVHVLLRLDAASVGADGDYPLAWSHTVGSGRVYYNALGHFAETWRDQRFLRQIAGAIRWTGKKL